MSVERRAAETGKWHRLPAGVAFYLEVSISVAILSANIAPSPLYAVYQKRWGFTSTTLTVVFAIYAVGVLGALLIAGSLSDYLGRRPVVLVAIVLQIAGLGILVVAGGVTDLVVGRVIQGISNGLAAGAVGAGLVDLDPSRGTVANAVAPLSGTAAGTLLSALLVQYLPAPTRLVYLVLAGVLIFQALGVLIIAETAEARPGALASLRPRFNLPTPTRRPLLIAAPALVAAWALFGFYSSLGPSLARTISHSNSVALGSLVLFLIAAASVLCMFFARHAAPATLALVGTAALVIGVGITVAATAARSEAGLFAGAAVAGVGFGGGFQGAIGTVLPTADASHRAGVLSVIYVVSYLSLGIPAVIAGVVVTKSGSLEGTAIGYGSVLIALAAVAFVGLARRARAGLCPPEAVPIGACIG